MPLRLYLPFVGAMLIVKIVLHLVKGKWSIVDYDPFTNGSLRLT